MSLSGRTFHLTWEQIDSIVIEEMKDSLDTQFHLSYNDMDKVDWKLIEALETVLGYYMDPSEFDLYKRELALQKLSLTSQLLGGYE